MPKPQFVEVILPLALPKLYTYSVPNDLELEVKPGIRVVVQFGKKKLYSAIVYRVHSNAPEAYQTKDILQVIDTVPIVSDVQFGFWEWMASYYMCSLGEVMKASLPSGLKMESETQIALGQEYALAPFLNDFEMAIMSALDEKKSISIQQLVSKVDFKNPIGVIKGLLDRRVLSVHENIQSAFKPKYEVFVRLHSRLKADDDVNKLFEELSRAPAQQKYLMAFLALTAPGKQTFTGWIAKKVLTEKADASPAAFKALVDKNIFEIESREPWTLRLVSRQGAIAVNVTTTLSKTISLGGIQQGVYILHAQKGNHVEQHRVVVE